MRKSIAPVVISIPEWYDYKLLISIFMLPDTPFQFQNGTIISRLTTLKKYLVTNYLARPNI